MAGVGQYSSAGAAAASVKIALHSVIVTALAAAGEDQVEAAFGFPWPVEHDDVVAVTRVRMTPQEGTVSPTRRRHQDVYVDVEIDSWRNTHDEREVHDIAYGLLSIVDAAVLADPTMGGKALWCLSDDLESDGATDNEETGQGRICAIRATYRAQVLIRLDGGV